jgi:chaperonin GroES
MIKPLNDRIVVKKTIATERTSGGIYIPATAQGTSLEGVVMSVGSGYVHENGTRREPQVKVGDTVLVGKYSGTIITHNDEEVLIIREDEILAIIA